MTHWHKTAGILEIFYIIVWRIRIFVVPLQKKAEVGKKMTRKDRQELFAQVSKFFVDIAKLVFGGVILAGILKQDVDFWMLISGGAVVMAIMLYAGYLMFRNSKK